MAYSVFRSGIAGHDCVYGTATINLPGHDRIPLRTVIDIQHTRHDALGDVCTSQRSATVIVDRDDIPMLDVALLCL